MVSAASIASWASYKIGGSGLEPLLLEPGSGGGSITRAIGVVPLRHSSWRSTCNDALDLKTRGNKSAVGGVAKMGAAQRRRGNIPSRPQWSTWAWVTITPSTWGQSISGTCRFLCSCSGDPWKSPKSITTRPLGVSSNVQDPVTSPAAPNNVIVARSDTETEHSDHLK